MKDQALAQKAAQVIESTLQKAPALTVIKSELAGGAPHQPDFILSVESPDGYASIIGEFRSSGEPRHAREAVNQLLRLVKERPDAYGVFVARYISPQAADICREAGIGYHDLAGNCMLSFGNVYIERQGNPNPAAEKRGLRTLYSPKASRILRVMLQNPKRRWKLQALADEARVSLGQVHKVKSALADREWTQSDSDGIWLSKPRDLLDEWAANYKYRRNHVREYYSLQPVGEVETAVAELCSGQGAPYALSGFSAAVRLAPFVRYQRSSAFVEEDAIAEVVKVLKLKEVTSGANVGLWTPYDEGVWYGTREVDGVKVTSPVQTYLDLQSMRGRGEEAAESLLTEVIEPGW